MKVKRKQKPQRRCIFCGGIPISREHIFPAWMREFLPPTDGSVHLISGARLDNASGQIIHAEPIPGILQRPGQHRSKKLKVVCCLCNNRWMSVLQNDAKPLLIPLMQGSWKQRTPRELEILIAWATMFTMVYEFSHPGGVTTTEAERKEFMTHCKPLRNWLICFGRYEDVRPLPVWARRINVNKVSKSTDKIGITREVKLTLFSVGRLAIQTFCATDDEVFSTIEARLRRDALYFGFRILWPSSIIGRRLKRPTRRIVRADAMKIMNRNASIFFPNALSHNGDLH